MDVVPMSITDARLFVKRVHRHHKPPVSGLFAIGLAHEYEVVGCAIVGRPVARMLQDGFTAEVTRVAVVDGIKCGCSMLYGACWRAAKAMGYRRLVTYTLDSEPGTSLVASGWKRIGEAGGGSWSRPSRPRIDKHTTQLKIRWQAPIAARLQQKEQTK